MQDTYDIISGKTETAKIKTLYEKDGKSKAERLKHPLVARDSFVEHLIPSPVVGLVEPVYFNFREYLTNQSSKGGKLTIQDLLVKSLKEMAPKHVNNVFELILVMIISFWIIILSKLFKINGHLIVNVPRINQEEGELKKLSSQ